MGLCVVVALLWTRMEHQVTQNQADIAALKAYSDAQDTRLRAEGTSEQARLENRWGKFLMPVLRQHHEAIQSLPLPPAHVQPLPEWLREKP